MWESYIKDAKSLLVRTLEDIESEGCEWLDEETMTKNLEYLEGAIDYLGSIKL